MTPDTASFDLTRTFGLAPERLWDILTDPEHREQWGAPSEGMVLTVETSDLREGGQDRHRCGPEDAPEFVVDTRWYRLDAPRLAVFTETLRVGGDAIFTSLVTYAVEDAGGGSALAVTVALSSFVGPEAEAEVREGWNGGLANLERYVGTLDAANG
jgi:uncharacterized protein YndB with AHSA1/START domain